MELSRCSINSITVRALGLPALLREAGRLGVAGVAPWRELIAPYGAAAAGRMIADAGLGVSGLCRGGMFTASTAAGRRAAVADNLRAIDEARALGADVLVLVCGPVTGRDPGGSRTMIRDGIEAVLDHARAAGVRLGVEPLHPMMAADRSAVTSLREANALRQAIGDPQLGVIVDAYHVWWEHDLEAQIAAAAGHLLGFHVSDWVTPIEGQLSSRGMPGDGCIDLRRMRACVEGAGFRGLAEVEILSDRWWAEEPRAVLDLATERFRDVV
ncbi:sugar phosphate isomerase/epimerase family protein [Streptomyces pinistramenti]|uniref:sugar phosphate isomerase/epimerase family protein n=1 Tax=Streptomyces pinistramenti TaxID=2884812 RepID=UPI001D067BC5|nr:sugar phosphate isomerase/epimerase family protein [Streptomyces pinistramenti]MCB5909517.1 sugar phosphate isomerase/epimerase [Streptomyces pinistramenti]